MVDREQMKALITAINDLCNEFSRYHDEELAALNAILKAFCKLTDGKDRPSWEGGDLYG